jgi:hypothetical protein
MQYGKRWTPIQADMESYRDYLVLFGDLDAPLIMICSKNDFGEWSDMSGELLDMTPTHYDPKGLDLFD